MRSGDLVDMIRIRDIAADDIDGVYWFIVREEGEAMIASDRRFVEALIRNGELRIDGRITWLRAEQKASGNTDFLKWIVDGKGYHFGKIACLNDEIIGVLLCYTKSKGRNIAYISNLAVAKQYRRRGVGSTLMRELKEFYRPQKDIEAIELGVGITNSIALKFYLKQGFRIKEIRDLAYTIGYPLVSERQEISR